MFELFEEAFDEFVVSEQEQPEGRLAGTRDVGLTWPRLLAYAEPVTGPELILVHGALTALNGMWLALVPTLSRHLRTSVVDRRGHGESDHVRISDASLWRQAEIVRDFVRHLHLDNPIVVGHSFGGAVALAYGMAYPDETKGAVAISPICFPEPRLEQVMFGLQGMPLSGDALSRMVSGPDAALLPLLWRAMFLPQAIPTRFASEFPFHLAGRADRLVADGENANMIWTDLARSSVGDSKCRVPIHVLCGSADIVTNPFLHGRQAALLVRSARFSWLPGLGHMLHHFRPEAVATAIRELVDSDDQGTRAS